MNKLFASLLGLVLLTSILSLALGCGPKKDDAAPAGGGDAPKADPAEGATEE